MAPERFVLSASAILPIFLIMGAGSRTPIMGSRPVRGRPRFLRLFGHDFRLTKIGAKNKVAPSVTAALPALRFPERTPPRSFRVRSLTSLERSRTRPKPSRVSFVWKPCRSFPLRSPSGPPAPGAFRGSARGGRAPP